MTDEQIITGCINRDARCETELYNRYKRKMVAKLRYHCSNEYIIEEAIQEGFTSIFLNIKNINNTDALFAWMFQIIKNQLYSLQRKHMSEKRIFEYRIELPTEPPDFNFVKKIDTKFDMTTIYQEINKLPTKQCIIYKKYIEGFKAHEIAKELNISVGCVKKQIHYAKRHIASNAIISAYEK